MLIDSQFGAIAWKYTCKESSVGCRLQIYVMGTGIGFFPFKWTFVVL